MIDYNDFCDNFAYLRRISGLPLKKFADKLGLSVYTARRIEKGFKAKRLRGKTILNIYEFFGVSPSVMFGKSKDKVLQQYNEFMGS